MAPLLRDCLVMRNVFVLLCLALGGCCFFPFLGAQSLTKHAVAKPTPIAAPDPWEPTVSQPPQPHAADTVGEQAATGHLLDEIIGATLNKQGLLKEEPITSIS